jgi:hypothetical protein
MSRVTTNVRGWAGPKGCGLFSCSFCFPDADALDEEIGPEIEAAVARARVREAILEAEASELNDCR